MITYGKNHPYGEYISEASVSNVQLADVKSYYSKNFNPENAYLVIVGDVDFATVKKQVTKLFKGWKGKAAAAVPFPAAKNTENLEVNFVDMPNAVQSEVSVALTTESEKNRC